MIDTGHRLGCDCCNGRETMAIEYADRIEIRAKHHGSYHTLILPKMSITAEPNPAERERLRKLVFSSTN
jgi:hypothetical protein